jgi:hypothetical protein
MGDEIERRRHHGLSLRFTPIAVQILTSANILQLDISHSRLQSKGTQGQQQLLY